MFHSLVEIPIAQWSELRDLYAALKSSSSAYNLLHNFINWAAQDPDLEVKIYSLDGDWEQDGTFVVHDNFMKEQLQIYYCNTRSDNQERLVQALNCIDSKVRYLIAGFPERLLPAVEQHFTHAGHAKEDFKPDGTFWYHISTAEAAQFSTEAPEGITLAQLELQHAEQVNSVWSHRAPGSLEFIKRLIRLNGSVGAFDKEGALVAWSLMLPLGSLRVLHVAETHRRQGLGNLVVRYMAKQSAANNLESTAPVVYANVPSRQMFEKLGFKAIDKVYWALMPPKGTTELEVANH